MELAMELFTSFFALLHSFHHIASYIAAAASAALASIPVSSPSPPQRPQRARLNLNVHLAAPTSMKSWSMFATALRTRRRDLLLALLQPTSATPHLPLLQGALKSQRVLSQNQQPLAHKLAVSSVSRIALCASLCHSLRTASGSFQAFMPSALHVRGVTVSASQQGTAIELQWRDMYSTTGQSRRTRDEYIYSCDKPDKALSFDSSFDIDFHQEKSGSNARMNEETLRDKRINLGNRQAKHHRLKYDVICGKSCN